jgi:hypothetical protein
MLSDDRKSTEYKDAYPKFMYNSIQVCPPS